MPEVYASNEVTAELLDPVSGSVITSVSIPFRRDLTLSERPVYAQRGYHRSNTLSAANLRSLGSVSLRKDAESLALAAEIKRWQKGVVFYALSSDLKGQRYRHPHLRVTFTNADGTNDVQTAYNVKLSDRSLSAPDGGIVGDSLSLDVLGGFEPKDGGYDPVRALDFHRTGPATHLSTAGTLTTAGDGVARIGLPWVVRRNLFANSRDLLDSGWLKVGSSVTYAGLANPVDGENDSFLVSTASAGATRTLYRAINPTGNHVLSVYAKKSNYRYIGLRLGTGSGTAFATFDLDTASWVVTPAGFTVGAVALADGWFRLYASYNCDGSVGPTVLFGTVSSSGGNFTSPTDAAAYFYGPQFEAGTTPTPYQPTNATGVDLTHPLNGAGLVLEGQGMNLCLYSQDFSNAAWSKTGSTTTTAADPSGAATAITIDMTGGGASVAQSTSAAWGTNTFTGSIWLKGASGGEKVVFGIRKSDSSGDIASSSLTLTNTWQRYSVTGTGTGSTNVNIFVARNQTTSSFSAAWAQVEQNPFPTSYIPTTTAAATRQPDLCGILPLQNELANSHDLTQGAIGSGTWNRTAGASVAKAGTANTLTLAATSDAIYQAVTPASVPSTTRTAAAKLRLGTLSGSIRLRLLDQAGNQIASTTINTSDLHATDARTFYVTGTAASDDTGLRVQIIGNSGTGTVIVESLRLVRGSHPGVEVQTGDTPIPAPVSPALDPAWQQNGAIELGFTWPQALSSGSYPTGKNFAAFGAADGSASSGFAAATLNLWRDTGSGNTSDQWITERKHNSSTGSGSTAGRARLLVTGSNLFSGAKRTIRIEWQNYTVNSVRYMPQRIYVDGALITEQDAAALYGATAWATIDPSRLVSDGNVFAVLSNLTLGYPTLPAGAIPAV